MNESTEKAKITDTPLAHAANVRRLECKFHELVSEAEVIEVYKKHMNKPFANRLKDTYLEIYNSHLDLFENYLDVAHDLKYLNIIAETTLERPSLVGEIFLSEQRAELHHMMCDDYNRMYGSLRNRSEKDTAKYRQDKLISYFESLVR